MKALEIETRIAETNEKLVSQEDTLVQLKTTVNDKIKELPSLRNKAYPKTKDGTPEAQAEFKSLLDSINSLKREIHDVEFLDLVKTNKTLSAMRYFLFNIERMKKLKDTGNLKILSINLTQDNIEDIDVSIIENLSTSNEIKTTIYPEFNSDLQNEIETSDIIFTFSREKELEQLRNFGIKEATPDNRKYVSIHHLCRFLSDFDRKDFQFYVGLSNLQSDEKLSCNSTNILNLFMDLLDMID